ncbi:metal dependent phosphohydrolase [Gamsiella multidivaricata]|uniref:metal dependent phosphohydrolase n=1 Tax=Gamsiella multidivaricata TaxID=101098 RepID=UPI0022203436|nr:metal dependent phosphohydrolase [Gamsiella multidivaricata]KAG0364798.1 hypothetical protein BGZ54_007164 [Gamsiella multidivaricata]KAI7828822.1 metal dependent phosphohydrolase [Gamsiella multidivaricata]
MALEPIIRTEAEELVKEQMAAYDPSHDWLHVDRVRRQALKIAKEEISQSKAVDLELVELAALFHDIGDAKFHKEGQPTGREIVMNFLSKHGYKRADEVAKIVENVSFRKELAGIKNAWAESCIELHIVQDADKLDAIGAFGILRCAAYSGYKNRPLYDPAEKAQLNMTYEQYQAQTKANTGCAISHFHEKLFRLKDMMKTSTAIKMAQKRHDLMVSFVQQIEEEYSMDE